MMTNADSARTVRTINQRLSLRKPQADSLEILADILDQMAITKEPDTAAALAVVQQVCRDSGWPVIESFERDFPSLCFALATGVGKTRLMGAFISYLYLTGKSRHFFVLAPNTTIYNKLISDFSPHSAKYVFKGIAEFAQNPPLIITGDNYESGIGVRNDRGGSTDLFGSDVHINIFNIDKINREEGPRGKPKMRSLQETMGESYYSYLSKLDDLVLVMDEAHRYRASAGVRAIEGLKPILGLELTATPKAVGTNDGFKNVIYRYGLGEAMADGFVKEPYVATRKDFDPKSVSEERLERIKLEDAVYNHDHVAIELNRYHQVSGKPKVHPFILVVAQHTEHAAEIRRYIESEEFFKARFKGKVIEVHSALRGEENEQALERLVSLENNDQTDIVIHVNKLKEGWDVTNLYTIVPLRASASDILTEQTLGRGLRLPFGMRVSKGEDDEFAAVDRLTVIAHDRFDDVINEARKDGSIVMKTMTIGEGGDVSSKGETLLDNKSSAEAAIFGSDPATHAGAAEPPTPAYVFQNDQERRTAEVTIEVIRRYEPKLANVSELSKPEIMRQITQEVEELMRPAQGTLEGIIAAPKVNEIVSHVAGVVADKIISIPRIVVIPKRQVSFEFKDFDLQDLSTIKMQPIEDGLVVQSMRTQTRVYLARSSNDQNEERLENYLVRYLIEQNEIDYDAHADLLYKLAGQLVEHLRSYLSSEDDVENVLARNGRDLANFIFAQMKHHYAETPLGEDDYEVRITRGFTLSQGQPVVVPNGQAVRPYTNAVSPKSETKKHVFGGFKRCCAQLQKFDSDPERAFAALLEADASVEKWVKPARAQFQIEYRSGDAYEPDFVVETKDAILICEIKAQNEVDDPSVIAKAQAAVKWCKAASQHAAEHGAKPWSYLLIPDDKVMGSATLDGLKARFVK